MPIADEIVDALFLVRFVANMQELVQPPEQPTGDARDGCLAAAPRSHTQLPGSPTSWSRQCGNQRVPTPALDPNSAFVMSSSDDHEPISEMQPTNEFVSTHWSLVLRAGNFNGEQAGEALAALCQRYWLPLYVFVRHRVSDLHEAQDLTQEFFARLLEKNVLADASPMRGRFRAFLLTAFKNFLANEWDRTQAVKRGGGRERLSLDWEAGESRLSLEPSHDLTPERLFDRQWTLTLLEHVVSLLQGEFESAGKKRQFELLKGTLTGESPESSYSIVAAELGMSEEAARQAAHRLKKRYRELLKDVVAQTVLEPDDLDDEIRQLFESLRP